MLNVYAKRSMENHTSKVKELVEKIQLANTTDEFKEISDALKGMPAPEGFPWLKHYYLGLCHILHSMLPLGAAKRDSLVTLAEAQALRLLKDAPKEAEAYVLRGFCYQAKIMVAVWARGPMYLSDVERCLNKALKLSPNNPRALFLMAQTVFNKPVFLGGGKRKAKVILQKALREFGQQPLPHPLYPQWGKAQAEELLAEIG